MRTAFDALGSITGGVAGATDTPDAQEHEHDAPRYRAV